MASVEDLGMSCSQEDSEGNTKQLLYSESSKESSGQHTTDESNDMTLSASSNTSSKCDSNQDLEGTEKSIDSTHVSGKTRKPKVKVVTSRYKASAVSRTNTISNNSSGSSSSQSRSWSNETINAGPSVSKKQIQKSKLIRGKPEDLLRTKPNIPGQSISTTRQAAPHQPGSQRSIASKPRSARVGASKPSKSGVVTSKDILHSTALNTTLMADVASGKNNSMLSSTIVSGVTPGGFKHNSGRAALLELPDISVIRPEGNNSGNRTVLSSVSEEEPQNYFDANTLAEVTPEMLEQEYMKYLHWGYVDVSSKKAFTLQLREMQKQIAFLEHLVSEKQEEVSELKQKTDILVHHQRVSEAYDLQMKLLEALGNDLPACEEAERVMERELEKKLHQIKMENIYVPQDHAQYRDELSDALNTQVSLLQNLENLMEPQTQKRNSTIKLVADLQNITERVLRCEKEMQHAAGMAVEEASHQLGAKQMALAIECNK
ncbi:uncharacterized protein LOC123503738 [Portunus trituberculatus]|nr:uncharacterized protein LOC123503738 [Portunus trituberculatus]XP_045109665.1 uncharacterized protein LOC123503738 [Portunus trituberculatus]XP_045109666.1 uncharacterized protein LOC123503738 [Portunus trituberculatus]XP_045109667.1 uncharacterized protein LOC123503738 [Portunus trituberculatus]XP_045109668.1 uncharacterized protein LOC123503738 [Portunus trituberculatus]XP_045109669.1 uncharacterized protein LOC123503738 [Portunus trituberculatus]